MQCATHTGLAKEEGLITESLSPASRSLCTACQPALKAELCKADGHPGNAVLFSVSQEELSDAKSMIEEISAKQEEMQQKIEQLQQEKRRESRKMKAK